MLAEIVTQAASSQFGDLLGTALAACLTALVASLIGWARAHVKNRTARIVIDSLAKGIEDADHDETRAAVILNAAAAGVEKHVDAALASAKEKTAVPPSQDGTTLGG